MQIAFSSIHTALGAQGSLDYALVEQAVDERLAEDEQLDWKRELPSDGDELAKDVAALANARGGLLVYGVAEDRRTGQAAKVMPVSVAEGDQRRLRSLIGTRINPQVAGIEITPMPSPDAESTGVLVVQVPESPDAPHFIGKDSSLGAPYRMGTQTFWMREWDLEAAYQRRFARRVTDEERLADLINHLSDQVDVSRGCWIVGATRPTVQRPATLPPPDVDGARETIQRARALGVNIAYPSDGRAGVIGELDQEALNPRVGLRRWIARTRTLREPESLSDLIHLELHHDGSSLLAVRVDGWYHESITGKNCLPDFMITGFAADFVALAASIADAAGLTGQAVARVDLLRADDSPFALLAPEIVGATVISGLKQQPWTTDVRRFLAVEAVLPRTDRIAALREVAETIGADVVTQFGHPPAKLRWPPVGPSE